MTDDWGAAILTEQLQAAGIPIQGAGRDNDGNIRVDFDATATAAQVALAERIVRAFVPNAPNKPQELSAARAGFSIKYERNK